MKLEQADTKPAWCPGCGNYPILKAIEPALDEAGIDRRKLVLVSGIGQAAKLPHYVRANVFNGLHGRALPAATGIKLANHSLKVVITSGDGDMYGEGGNHFVHAIRRNIGVVCFVHNNQVYGLTKGQASPTSDPGMQTKIQTHGVISRPMNPLTLAISQDASFVARTFAGDAEHMKRMMVAALQHPHGFALLDILQPCVTFNRRNTFRWYKERCKEVSSGHDPYDKHQAIKLAELWGDRIYVGVLYKCRRKPFEQQIELLRDRPLVEQY